jgi:hypothetical protein
VVQKISTLQAYLTATFFEIIFIAFYHFTLKKGSTKEQNIGVISTPNISVSDLRKLNNKCQLQNFKKNHLHRRIIVVKI